MVGAVGAYSVLGVLGLSQYVILGNNQQIMSNAPEKPGSPSRLNLYFISTENPLNCKFLQRTLEWTEYTEEHFLELSRGKVFVVCLELV